MHLDLDDLAIRSYQESDLPQLVKQANDRAIWLNLTDGFPHPYTMQNGRDWISIATSQEPETNFAIVSGNDAVIGGVGLEIKADIYRCTAEIGYWLGRAWWGQGIATRALRALTDWGLRTFALERLQAGVFETNPASARVLEKAGYRLEGRLKRNVIKDGKVLDLMLYATTRPEYHKPEEEE
ncbi:MAG: GNAT family N-acetyltransferase [Candidatus Delongbacteria bacterium]|nr:GNAT family N-acetyltransferase [Candidatus Delongbacteria bacterium]